MQWTTWMIRRCSTLQVGLLLTLGLSACKVLHSGADIFPVQMEITHLVSAEPLRLDDTTQPAVYKTAAGDEFSVTRLRYYLSNFRLRRADGSWYQEPADPKSSTGYFLVDAADASSQHFDFIRAPAGDYTGIEFLIGVDEARNTAGAQNGTLDPARGMFWTWHTGYIFFAMEGQSPQSTADQHALSFHLGGGGAATLARTVFLPAGETPLRVRPDIEPLVHLHADVGALFEAPHVIRFAETNTIMDAGQGGDLADNAAGMFRIDHIHNEPRRNARAS